MTDQATPLANLLGDIRQLGYVVEDLDTAVAAWSTQLRVGPWTIIKNIPLASVYRGIPSTPVIDIALGYRGALQIELIRQTNDAPSPYRESIARRQFGLHHTAFMAKDIHATVCALQARGLKVECDIQQMPGAGRYVYFASPVPDERSFIEILEATPQNQALFEQGVPAAAHWDGRTAPTVIDFAALGS
ncbi:MAG TPA: VOC family protein [Nevskiaceae bacterium]|nr:VOC family protein [Nevskiaceae bacterium]